MPPTFSEMQDSNGRIARAIDKVGRGRLTNAYTSTTFVYGTTGGGVVGPAVEQWQAYVTLSRKANNAMAAFVTGEAEEAADPMRKLNIYDPGPRTKVALDNQMMDLYYGQEGTSVHERRDRTIGEYVHFAMGFDGFYDHRLSGRETYLKTFGRHPDGRGGVIEGWMSSPKHPSGYKEFGGCLYPDPEAKGKGLSATKEMSRVIRTGIFELGGTLVFEGTNVTYQSVFVPGAYVSDTSLEAESLFKFFTPGKSRVPYGKGTLIFHWHGQEVVPSHALFHSNWLYHCPQGGSPTFHKLGNQRKDHSEPVKPIYNNFVKISVVPDPPR